MQAVAVSVFSLTNGVSFDLKPLNILDVEAMVSGGKIGSSLNKNSQKKKTSGFKRSNPHKTASKFPGVICKDRICHRDQYFQTGDIVSVADAIDGQNYFAQIRGILQDEYLERGALLSWLIPISKYNSEDAFHPDNFVIGPSEDFPRNMDYLTFVCHAPQNLSSIVSSTDGFNGLVSNVDNHSRGFITYHNPT